MKELLDSAGFVALVSTGGTIAVAYIINVVAKKRRVSKPVDRMETIFDGYEKLIVQQQEEIVRKGATITQLEGAVNRLEEQLDETRKLLNRARGELRESKDHNRQLQVTLDDMKKDYKKATQHGN